MSSAIQINAMANETYKKPSDDELKKTLTTEQYSCTQKDQTETPFHNKYWDNKEDGIYVDVVSGEPLFLSLDKYDSGTGWPSFTKPIEKNNLKLKSDSLLGYERIEVRSKSADSHLGHVFDDGPKDAGGKRFCMNSAALNFIPLNKMSEKGFGNYLFMFASKKHWDIAVLAGGCFWGVEDIFRKENGVAETQVGYTGGKTLNPLYETVHTGATGHAEAVKILFDPAKITYEKLLELFFKLHDPTTKDRQGNDVGTQYRSAIFYQNEKQKLAAEKIKLKVEKSGVWKKPIVTQIEKADAFYTAEEYHQKYLKKNPAGYTCHYIREVSF
ncbi:MAG: bifunctional methionine sulfoxide reductase B/A protein [Bdellovibrionales bacterium]